MTDVIAATVLLVILALAAGYVIKAKKKGVKCIGCPDGCCSKKGGCASCSCCGTAPQEE